MRGKTMNLKYAKEILSYTIRDGLLSELEIEALRFILSQIENPKEHDNGHTRSVSSTKSIFDNLRHRY